jgi:hypothetical protein
MHSSSDCKTVREGSRPTSIEPKPKEAVKKKKKKKMLF